VANAAGLGSPLFSLRPLASRRRLTGKPFESWRADGRAASRRFENDIGVRRKEAWRLAGEAKGEADMLAPEDVPYWAVTIAERKWYRGESRISTRRRMNAF